MNADGWQQLGIRERTAATIVKYVGRGGKFRQPEDIGKIYGLSQQDYARLLPFVKIPPSNKEKNAFAERESIPGDNKPRHPAKKIAALNAIDINHVDTTDFIALPGIGSKLAARMVAFRDKLGGFYAVKQVAETYGLPDSTFNKIQALLRCEQPVVRRIDINTADANALKQHPYIRWNLANAIVQYRTQHGSFKSVDDLQQIALVTPEIFEKIKMYLTVQ